MDTPDSAASAFKTRCSSSARSMVRRLSFSLVSSGMAFRKDTLWIRIGSQVRRYRTESQPEDLRRSPQIPGSARVVSTRIAGLVVQSDSMPRSRFGWPRTQRLVVRSPAAQQLCSPAAQQPSGSAALRAQQLGGLRRLTTPQLDKPRGQQLGGTAAQTGAAAQRRQPGQQLAGTAAQARQPNAGSPASSSPVQRPRRGSPTPAARRPRRGSPTAAARQPGSPAARRPSGSAARRLR